MDEFLAHAVFNPGTPLPARDPLDDGRWFARWLAFFSHMQVWTPGLSCTCGNCVSRLSQNMPRAKHARHPMIWCECTGRIMPLVHTQVQANGEAARLAQMIEHLGGMPWLDMKAANLTAEGMKHGVRRSDVFILFLTSDVLTRPYCLLEIITAMDAGKHIMILREEDKRFFPWEFEQWKQNNVWDKKAWKWVSANPTAFPGWQKTTFPNGQDVWQETATGKVQTAQPVGAASVVAAAAAGPYDRMASALGSPGNAIYFSAEDHLKIRDMIEANRHDMLTIRRRDFEVEALAREIIRRSGHKLPDDPSATPLSGVSSMTLTAIFAPGPATVGGGEDVAKALQTAVEGAGAKWTVAGAAATHTVIILTGGLLQSPALANQVRASGGRSGTGHVCPPINYLYLPYLRRCCEGHGCMCAGVCCVGCQGTALYLSIFGSAWLELPRQKQVRPHWHQCTLSVLSPVNQELLQTALGTHIPTVLLPAGSSTLTLTRRWATTRRWRTVHPPQHT